MCKARTNFIETIVRNAVDVKTLSSFEPRQDLVKAVRFDGPVTTAAVGVKILGDVYSATGSAKCSPRDEFSFTVGENLAVARAAATVWRMFTGKRREDDKILHVELEGEGSLVIEII